MQFCWIFVCSFRPVWETVIFLLIFQFALLVYLAVQLHWICYFQLNPLDTILMDSLPHISFLFLKYL